MASGKGEGGCDTQVSSINSVMDALPQPEVIGSMEAHRALFPLNEKLLENRPGGEPSDAVRFNRAEKRLKEVGFEIAPGDTAPPPAATIGVIGRRARGNFADLTITTPGDTRQKRYAAAMMVQSIMHDEGIRLAVTVDGNLYNPNLFIDWDDAGLAAIEFGVCSSSQCFDPRALYQLAAAHPEWDRQEIVDWLDEEATPAEIEHWAASPDGGLYYPSAVSWIRSGESKQAMDEWIAAAGAQSNSDLLDDIDYDFYDYDGAAEWIDGGFTPQEAIAWIESALDPDDASEWRSRGFDPETAAGYWEYSYTPEEAEAAEKLGGVAIIEDLGWRGQDMARDLCRAGFRRGDTMKRISAWIGPDSTNDHLKYVHEWALAGGPALTGKKIHDALVELGVKDTSRLSELSESLKLKPETGFADALKAVKRALTG